MSVEIREVGAAELPLFGDISIAFEVSRALRVQLVEDGLGGIVLREEKVERPYVKDYDSYEDEGPTRWPQMFDVSKWGIFLAFDGSRHVGGATVAFDTAAVNMLKGRKDLAVLWDIRVRPEMRRRGIGSALFRHALAWSRERGCKLFKVETQNINVAACRFYQKQGCKLGAINRYGYLGCPEIAHETMLLWYLEL